MLLSWSIFNAHKGYSEFIEKYTRSLLDHLSQDRLDSRGIRRAYKQYFGRSPQQLQTYARFNDSLYDYMKNGINPLWNYTDQAHWIRVCKKHTGMTPKRITSWHTLL
jgi:AraC-like DNA-binding protein